MFSLDVGTLIQTDALLLDGPQEIEHDTFVSILRLSPDGQHLAYGDDAGLVTIVNSSTLQTLVQLEAGSAIQCLLWHPSKPGNILVAAVSGYINDIQIEDSEKGIQDAEDFTMRALRIKGFITAMALDNDATVLAVAFDDKVQILPYPLHDEQTVITGHNLGQVPIASNGSVKFTRILGEEGSFPSQSLTCAKTDHNLVIASTAGATIMVWHLNANTAGHRREELVDGSSSEGGAESGSENIVESSSGTTSDGGSSSETEDVISQKARKPTTNARKKHEEHDAKSPEHSAEVNAKDKEGKKVVQKSEKRRDGKKKGREVKKKGGKGEGLKEDGVVLLHLAKTVSPASH
ncbi:hypothetical protein H1R20_g4500, partial [Candolleomyces eurysporus]